jgi:hypothetical protein
MAMSSQIVSSKDQLIFILGILLVTKISLLDLLLTALYTFLYSPLSLPLLSPTS